MNTPDAASHTVGEIIPLAFPGPHGTLRGIFHAAAHTPRPAPALVMLHGGAEHHIGTDRLWVQAANHLAAAGFAVLRFDFFGCGDSDGAFEQCTIHTQLADARAALEWLAGQPGIDVHRLAVLGYSMGGCVAALLAGQEPRLKALVLWNATGIPSRHPQDPRLWGSEDGIVGGMRLAPGFWTAYHQVDPAAALRRYAGPGLVIQAANDRVIAPEEAAALHAALGARGTLHHVAGADHHLRHPAWRREVFDRTARWLIACLETG